MFIVSELREVCGGCPSAWEGKLHDGRTVYFRYRWGYLSARVEGEDVLGMSVGDEFDGVMGFGQLRLLCAPEFLFTCDPLPPIPFVYSAEESQEVWTVNDRNEQ